MSTFEIRNAVRRWMRANVESLVDDDGEISGYTLAAAAIDAFELDAPADDDDHWIWDLADWEVTAYYDRKDLDDNDRRESLAYARANYPIY